MQTAPDTASSTCATRTEHAFELILQRSQMRLPVGPGESMADVLQLAGVPLETLCEQGVCGTCITRVLEGECDHRDLYFTDEEKARNDQFTPCCSRALSDELVLDL